MGGVRLQNDGANPTLPDGTPSLKRIISTYLLRDADEELRFLNLVARLRNPPPAAIGYSTFHGILLRRPFYRHVPQTSN